MAESFTQVAKGRMRCHSVIGIHPFFKATRHLENSVKFWWHSGWKQDIIQPCEKIAGSTVKTLQRKTLTVTMKIFSQHIIKLALGKSTQRCTEERGSTGIQPTATAHSWTALVAVEEKPQTSLFSAREDEEGQGEGFVLQTHFSSGRLWAFWICSHHALWDQTGVSTLTSVVQLSLLGLVTPADLPQSRQKLHRTASLTASSPSDVSHQALKTGSVRIFP